MSERNNMAEHLQRVYTAVVLENGPSLVEESPLHMTLSPPVLIGEEAHQTFIHLLQDNLYNFGPVQLKGENEAWFNPRRGETKCTHVRKIAKTAELACLHEIIMSNLGKVTGTIDGTFAYEHWSPHVSDQESRNFGRNEVFVADSVSVLAKHPARDNRTITHVSLIDSRAVV